MRNKIHSNKVQIQLNTIKCINDNIIQEPFPDQLQKQMQNVTSSSLNLQKNQTW